MRLNLAPHQEQEIKKGALSLYYRILGLSAEFDDSDEEFTTTSYMFNFRLIGPTLQSTQLTLHYGVSQVDSDLAGSQMDNQFAAMTLTLYIFHFFGLEGHYRSYFTATNDADIDSEGIRLSYGAFLEFGMLRLYGNLVHDTWTLTPPSSAKYDVERDGVEAGVQFYF